MSERSVACNCGGVMFGDGNSHTKDCPAFQPPVPAVPPGGEADPWKELNEARETIRRLNRRAQLAEAAVEARIEKFHQRSVGAFRAMYYSWGKDGYRVKPPWVDVNWLEEWRKVEAREAALRAELKADEERLARAGERVGLVFGCDTADHMADAIVTLRKELDQARQQVASLSEQRETLRAEKDTEFQRYDIAAAERDRAETILEEARGTIDVLTRERDQWQALAIEPRGVEAYTAAVQVLQSALSEAIDVFEMNGFGTRELRQALIASGWIPSRDRAMS